MAEASFLSPEWWEARVTPPSEYQRRDTERTNPTIIPGDAYSPGTRSDEFYNWRSQIDTIPGITWDEVLEYRDLFDSANSLPEAVSIIGLAEERVGKRISDERVAETERAAKERMTIGLSDVESISQAGEKKYGEQIGRLETMLDNPAAIRNDAQLGAYLRDMESSLSAQLGTIHQGAAKTTSQAGLRAAGKIDTGVRGAEIGAAGARGQYMEQLRADIEKQKTALDEGLFGFRTGIGSARNTVLGGGVADLGNVTALGESIKSPDFTAPSLTNLDVLGLGYGKSASDVGAFTAFANMLFQAYQNDKGSTLGALGGILGQ
jgi:hypothetical protein